MKMEPEISKGRIIGLEELGDEIARGSMGIIRPMVSDPDILIKHPLPESDPETIRQFESERDLAQEFKEYLKRENDGIEDYFVDIIASLFVRDDSGTLPAYSMRREERSLDDLINGKGGIFEKYHSAKSEEEKESITYRWFAQAYEHLLNLSLLLSLFHEKMDNRIVADIHPGNLLLKKDEGGREHIALSDLKGYDKLPTTERGIELMMTGLTRSMSQQRAIHKVLTKGAIKKSIGDPCKFDRIMYGRFATFVLLLDSKGNIEDDEVTELERCMENRLDIIGVSKGMIPVIVDSIMGKGKITMREVYTEIRKNIPDIKGYKFVCNDNGTGKVYTLCEYLHITEQRWRRSYDLFREKTLQGGAIMGLASEIAEVAAYIKSQLGYIPRRDQEETMQRLDDLGNVVQRDCEDIDASNLRLAREYSEKASEIRRRMEEMQIESEATKKIYVIFQKTEE